MRRRTKRFIPTILVTLLCWVELGYLIYKTSPHDTLFLGPLPLPSLFPFFLLLFLSFLFSFSLLFNNTRRGMLIAVGLTMLALLRFFQFFHPLYIILIVALLITMEIYALKK